MRMVRVGSGEQTRSYAWTRCSGLLTCLTVAAVAFGASPARADSGESSNTQGVYEISEEDCDELRALTGVPAGNVLFTCDADREECRLFIPEEDLDEGLALGFCADRFTDGVVPHEDGPIEEATTLEATTFGSDFGFEQGGVQGDVFCETFLDGSKVCRRIVEGDCTGAGDCPVCDDSAAAGVQEFILTQEDSCEDLQDLLAGSVTADLVPNPAFAVFFDVDQAGQPGSEALLVCPGFEWQCVPDPGAPVDGPATFQYSLNKHIIQTPGCLKIGGTCYRY